MSNFVVAGKQITPKETLFSPVVLLCIYLDSFYFSGRLHDGNQLYLFWLENLLITMHFSAEHNLESKTSYPCVL